MGQSSDSPFHQLRDNTMDNCKVYIIDDAEEVREALALLMESVGIEVELFASAEAFLDGDHENREGCILLDIRMPGMSGMELQSELNKYPCSPPVIIITGHGDIPMAVRAIQAGAINFIQKPFNEQELLDSVHRAFKLDSQRRGKSMEIEAIRKKLNSLTSREIEVLHAITEGKRNKAIAIELGISQSTVEAHRAKVMKKMAARSLSELMRMVICVEDH